MTIAEGLSHPEGLTLTPDGNLLVVETGAGQVSLIGPDTGKIRTIAHDLKLGVPAIPNAPPTWIFSDVAVDSSGMIFVTSDVENVLYRLEHYSIDLKL